MSIRMLGWAATLGLGLLAVASPVALAGDEPSIERAPFEFALIGDYPYWPRGYVGMPHLLDELRNDAGLSFVLHLGDMHNPRFTECSEALYVERRDWFTELGLPFILTPGDNDWADCEVDPVEQLSTIRRVFFGSSTAFGLSADSPPRSQGEEKDFPEIVENQLWERAEVVFATIHMIGSRPFPWPDETTATRSRLIAAAEAWLDEVFRVAESRGARGVFLATQVNLFGVSGNQQMLDLMNPGLVHVPSAFAPFQRKLIDHVRAFGGPVVMANGDSHTFRIDKPLFDHHLETIQTFTRVEGFGSPHGHWVRVRVDPERAEVFQFRQELVPENIYTLVPREERRDGFEYDDLAAYKVVARVLQTIQKLLMLLGAFALLSWIVMRVRARFGGKTGRPRAKRG